MRQKDTWNVSHILGIQIYLETPSWKWFLRGKQQIQNENEVLKDKTTIGHNYNRSHRFVLRYKWVSAVACNIHWLLGVTIYGTGLDDETYLATLEPWTHHLKYFDRFIGYRTRQVKVKVIIKNKFPGWDLVAGWQNYYENYRWRGPAWLRYVINHGAGLVTPDRHTSHHTA